jgi:hypothetical protein
LPKRTRALKQPALAVPATRPAMAANHAHHWRSRLEERRYLEDLRHAVARTIRQIGRVGNDLRMAGGQSGDRPEDGLEYGAEELRQLGNQLLDVVRALEHRAWS